MIRGIIGIIKILFWEMVCVYEGGGEREDVKELMCFIIRTGRSILYRDCKYCVISIV